ncbi:FkbM family methyltransferase [Zunongwangia sp. F363]|uniref:FkbM family methyltransferase n=1 Tax=Autumnicola tepida TaxID=3075595 RepID=A0ABU3CD65_9FLAO|nr:FkbM family methyltransferase [Zunongwangia sp. F363]MDT0643975.1 FkbM family methyltransferase [Zunongwangia sp. F363]
MNSSFIRFLYKRRLLQFLTNFSGRANINGKSFRIPIIGEMGYTNIDISEAWMVELFRIILPLKSGEFVDVGANIGQTLLKLRSLNSEMPYTGFEPNAACLFYLRRLIEKNNFTNCQIFPVGISEKTEMGKLNFYYGDDADSCASMLEGFRTKSVFRKEYVPLYHFSEVKSALQADTISILKIDVEGGELEVLNSFYHDIKEQSPIILLEILPVYKEENKERKARQDKIQEMLRALNYSIYRIYKEKGNIRSLKEIANIGIHSNLQECDYVVIPENLKQDFLKACGNLVHI